MECTSTPELKTARLVLNRFADNDTRDMYEGWANSEAATRWMFMEPGKSITQCAEYLASLTARYETDERFHQWAVRAAGRCIGVVALFVDVEHDSGRLAYVLREEDWNKGYMTEALREVIRFSFEALGLNRVYADHFAENAASGRVMEKAGMLREGVQRQAYRKFGGYHDAVLYGMTREDFLQGKSEL